MPTRKSTHNHATDLHACSLQSAIHALGDFAHVSVRAERGHLNIFLDDGRFLVARFTPLAAGQYGLSYHNTSGRWEKMPFVGELASLAQHLVEVLGPFLQRLDFPSGINGSDH
jgi:hypothetical protein